MRIRQIKPSFWTDPHISDLAEPTRLFYIGCWMLADDAGWLRWDTREVGNELYGYETVRRRESKVERMLAELVAAGRVRQYDCGHVEVPTLTAHQHVGPRRTDTAYREHQKQCFPLHSAEIRGSSGNAAMVRSGQVGSGQVSSGQVSEFQKKVARP